MGRRSTAAQVRSPQSVGGGLSRRTLLRRTGAGAAALTLPAWLSACGGDEQTGVPAGDGMRRFAGTTLNFISENTAPTSAIAASLEPFRQMTGIDVQIVQLELSALVQRVALDLASGVGSYHVIYADPYQILAPYHEALADLNRFQDDPNLPDAEDMGDFFPIQLDAAGRFGRGGEIYALPYDAPTLVWMYRRDVLEEHRERMQQDLGFDPMPRDDSTWDEWYETSRWLREHRDRTGIPYGTGHQARQHDSLMNDFSNVLWAYGGDYFKDGQAVGRFGSDDPGEPLLDRPEALEAADVYRRLVSVAHPSSTGWDWTGLAEAFGAGQVAMCAEWHEFAASFETGDLSGKVGYARLPRGPARSANMYGGCGIGINGQSTEREQQAAWLFVTWATSKEVQLAGLKSEVGGGTPTRESIYRLPEVRDAMTRPSDMPNVLTTEAVFQAWQPDNVGLRPKIAAWNECDTTIFTELSKMLAGKDPEQAMRDAKAGFESAIENASALRRA